jgi:AcrR family transcriptional regulator
MTDTKSRWITEGYKVFALNGAKELKIESLAKQIPISKSSFYHHFADLELFEQELLSHHLIQSITLAEKEKKAKNIQPELINILIEHKFDLLFNRQLRIHQQKENYKNIILKTTQIIGSEFIQIWQRELKIKLNQTQLESLYNLALENFYLKINENNINHQWLSDYFKNLNQVAKNFV